MPELISSLSYKFFFCLKACLNEFQIYRISNLIFTAAIHEIHDSRYNKGPSEATPVTPWYNFTMVFEGFHGPLIGARSCQEAQICRTLLCLIVLFALAIATNFWFLEITSANNNKFLVLGNNLRS